MKRYLIFNSKDDEQFKKEFEYNDEVRHWIINHLDLSKEWSFISVPYDDTNERLLNGFIDKLVNDESIDGYTGMKYKMTAKWYLERREKDAHKQF